MMEMFFLQGILQYVIVGSSLYQTVYFFCSSFSLTFAYSLLEVKVMCVCRGDMEGSVQMFEKAISLSKSESEMAHLYSLMDAAQIQMKVAQKLGIPVPLGGGAEPV